MRYSIGEDVFLVSSDDPTLNCECTVEDIVDGSYSVGVVGPNGWDLWNSSALRKRPKPATKTFEELMKFKVGA